MSRFVLLCGLSVALSKTHIKSLQSFKIEFYFLTRPMVPGIRSNLVIAGVSNLMVIGRGTGVEDANGSRA